VFEIDGTTTIYYKYAAVKDTTNVNSFPSAFDDLRAADGWFEEDGTAIPGLGPVPTSIVGSDVRISIYPTDTNAAPSATLQGGINFGDAGNNNNQQPTTENLKDFFESLEPTSGNVVHFSILAPGNASLGIRFFVNSDTTFDKTVALPAFRDMVNNGEAELRVITGASTYYATTAATTVSSDSVLQFDSGWVDENGTAVATADVRSAVSAFANVEIWAQ